jgi:asparagine synthase (glutamine-hydrolysing)
MCGIAGFIDFNKKSSKYILKSMTDVLHHRGPDDSGYSFYETNNAHIGLGHRRLSILDLSKHGHQPMIYKNIEIIYNGEIYNFKEIREELKKENYIFKSNSDTEVILKSYDKWGIKAINKFNGMFAIAIYDKKLEQLFLIRDRAGVKPLYWYWENNNFLFSSELKSFHKYSEFKKEIHINSLALYLQYGYIMQPHTIFKKTYKLHSGHYLKIDLKTKKIQEQEYWNVLNFYNKPKLKITESEAIIKIEKLLQSAFEYRMISDVPVGVFLSGGYDSSLVTAIIQNQRNKKLNTFTIGFHEKGFDEAVYAKKVAKELGTNHKEYYCTQKDALEIIPELAKIYDEPFGDSSAIPTILVSKMAKENVTVSLSADGGDEIFAGYTKYDTSLKYFQRNSKIPNIFKRLIYNIMNIINPEYIPILNNTYNFATKYEKAKNILKAKNISEIMKIISQQFTDEQINNLLKSNIEHLRTDFDNSILDDDINQMLAIDYKTYMNDCILTKVDRASMSVNLEGREPLLDHRIIEFMAQLPGKLKYNHGNKKYLLKQITHKYLPKDLMNRPKKGFGVPLTEWFKDELQDFFYIYLNKERLDKEGLFNVNEVLKLRDDYLKGNQKNIKQLWFILMFEMWYEEWM